MQGIFKLASSAKLVDSGAALPSTAVLAGGGGILGAGIGGLANFFAAQRQDRESIEAFNRRRRRELPWAMLGGGLVGAGAGLGARPIGRRLDEFAEKDFKRKVLDPLFRSYN